jgi:hypothetical protein
MLTASVHPNNELPICDEDEAQKLSQLNFPPIGGGQEKALH